MSNSEVIVCPDCQGGGLAVNDAHFNDMDEFEFELVCCSECNGTGIRQSVESTACGGERKEDAQPLSTGS